MKINKRYEKKNKVILANWVERVHGMNINSYRNLSKFVKKIRKSFHENKFSTRMKVNLKTGKIPSWSNLNAKKYNQKTGNFEVKVKSTFDQNILVWRTITKGGFVLAQNENEIAV
jgi:hypothetical protein